MQGRYYYSVIRCRLPGLRKSTSTRTGGLSRAISTAVLSPISLIKTQMEATGAFMIAPPNNMLTVATGIVRSHGVRGLWRGTLPTILSNAPFSGIYYCVYNELKKSASGFGGPQAAFNLGAGFVAAMFATLATQPMDVIRARIQLGASRGMLQSASMALKEHGGKVFMSGATPRFFKRSLQTALVWTLYEEMLPVVASALTVTSSST
jgi:solute carrier family 25, member 38